MNHKPYEQWRYGRRMESVSEDFSNQVMTRIAALEHQRYSILWIRCIETIENSRALQWAVCSGALAVGAVPFFFLAYVSKIVNF